MTIRLYEPFAEQFELDFLRERARLCVKKHQRGWWLFGQEVILNATNPLFYDAPCKAQMDNLTANLNSGTMRIYTGTQPALNGVITGTLLVTLTFGASAFAASTAAAGTVTANANAITSGTAGATGTAGYFALLKSDGTTVVATGSVGTSAADLNLTTLSIVSTAVVTCSAFSFTQSQA